MYHVFLDSFQTTLKKLPDFRFNIPLTNILYMLYRMARNDGHH